MNVYVSRECAAKKAKALAISLRLTDYRIETKPRRRICPDKTCDVGFSAEIVTSRVRRFA